MMCDDCKFFNFVDKQCTYKGSDVDVHMIYNVWNCRFKKRATGKQIRERKRMEDEEE